MTPVRATRMDELEIIPNAIEAVSLLNQNGYICPVVTVQSGIAKGRFSLDEFNKWFVAFKALLQVSGAIIHGPYLCPHRFDEPCECEKPKPYLYLKAARELRIDLEESVVIGDAASDVLAAKCLGCRGYLVRTGWGERAIEKSGADKIADFVAPDIFEAVNHILERV